VCEVLTKKANPMKQKKKKGLPKQRNEFVVQLIQRAGAGAGSHQKSKKASRRNDKMKLNKEWSIKVT
jgi:hypothetical protein